MSQKVEKVHNFLDPPPPKGNLRKIGYLITPPSDLIWEKLISQTKEFWKPPRKKNKLKIAKK